MTRRLTLRFWSFVRLCHRHRRRRRRLLLLRWRLMLLLMLLLPQAALCFLVPDSSLLVRCYPADCRTLCPFCRIAGLRRPCGSFVGVFVSIFVRSGRGCFFVAAVFPVSYPCLSDGEGGLSLPRDACCGRFIATAVGRQHITKWATLSVPGTTSAHESRRGKKLSSSTVNRQGLPRVK